MAGRATRCVRGGWREVGFLMRRKADLLPALHDPLFVRDGVRPRPDGRVQPPDLALLGRTAGRHPGSRDHEGELRGGGAARHRRLQAVLPVLHAVCGDDPQVRQSSALRDERDPGDRRRPRLRDRVLAAARGRELLARSLPAVQERDLRRRPRSRRQLLPLRRRDEAVRPPHVRRRDGRPPPRDEAGARPGVHPQSAMWSSTRPRPA